MLDIPINLIYQKFVEKVPNWFGLFLIRISDMELDKTSYDSIKFKKKKKCSGHENEGIATKPKNLLIDLKALLVYSSGLTEVKSISK